MRIFQPTTISTLIAVSILMTAVISLTGCEGVNPSSLRAAASQKTLQLEQPLVYDKTYAISGNKFQYTLAPGSYSAQYEDSKGTYYAGPDLCFKIELIATEISSQRAGLNKPTSYRCGIFAPTASTKPALIYIYFAGSAASPSPQGSSQTTTETSTAIANNTANNIGATPMQAGVGAGIAGGIVSALQEAEKDNFHIFENQPSGNSVRNAFSIQ